MKKIFAVAMMLLVAVSSMNAQDQKQILKERQEIAKLSKKELNSRATRNFLTATIFLTRHGKLRRSCLTEIIILFFFRKFSLTTQNMSPFLKIHLKA